MIVIVLNYLIASETSNLLLNQYKLSVPFAIMSLLFLIFSITIGLYVYNVYILNLGGGGGRKSNSVSRSQSKSSDIDMVDTNKKRLQVEPQ